MIIENKFDVKQIVYLKTDQEQLQRLVTAVTVKPDHTLIYELSCGVEVTSHHECEISKEKDINIICGIEINKG